MWVGGQRYDPAAVPPENRPGTHRSGGRVGSTAGLVGWTKPSAQYWRNDINMGNPKYSEKSLSLCQFV